MVHPGLLGGCPHCGHKWLDRDMVNKGLWYCIKCHNRYQWDPTRTPPLTFYEPNNDDEQEGL